jgi:SPX domain protein involved in polyphosphate accumulation
MHVKNSNSQSEHETKFVILNSRSSAVLEWLKLRCTADSRYSVNTVSSIYFDDPNWQYLAEKINSDFRKTKIRIRWYSDLNNKNHSDKSFLEIKRKEGAVRSKTRVATEYSGSWLSLTELEDTELSSIPYRLLSRDLLDLSGHIQPVFEISYKRARFTDSFTGIRICIDYNINVPRSNKNLNIQPNITLLRNAVVEIKGTSRELPVILHPLISFGCRKSSFSKYLHCYRHVFRYGSRM